MSVCSPPPLDCQLLEGRRCVSLTCLYPGAPPFLAVWPQTGCLTSAVPSVKWEQRCLPLTHVTERKPAAFRHSSAAAASQKTCGRNQIRHSFSTPRPGNLQEQGSAIPGGAVSAVWLHNCCLLTWRGEDRAMACGPPLPSSVISCCRQRAGSSQGPDHANLAVLPRFPCWGWGELGPPGHRAWQRTSPSGSIRTWR